MEVKAEGERAPLMKQCRTCRHELPAESFHRRASAMDGLSGECKGCVGERGGRWRQRHRGDPARKKAAATRAKQRAAANIFAHLNGTAAPSPISKKCCTCREIKPASEFYCDRRLRDGLKQQCKECHNVSVIRSSQRRRMRAPEEMRARGRLYRKRWYARMSVDPEWRRQFQESQRAARERYYASHPERLKQIRINTRLKKKVKVLTLISGSNLPVCEWCGCDDIRALEANHKNGGGSRERITRVGPGNYIRSVDLYRKILTGNREVGDLNVLCRPCNALEYLLRKIPGLKGKWEIRWRSRDE